MIKTLFPEEARFDADSMMTEALEQMEFQFGWDEAEKAVENAADRAPKYWRGRERVQTWGQLVAQQTDDSFAETWRSGFENGDMFVDCRFMLSDPLDMDFYDQHSAFLEEIRRTLPKGFSAEYDDGGSFDQDAVEGNKFVVGYSAYGETGPAGRDDYDTYDVVERLWISKK